MSPLLLSLLPVVLATHAPAQVTAHRPSLKALTVLFHTSAFLAVAADLVSWLLVSCYFGLEGHRVLFQYYRDCVLAARFEFGDVAAVVAATAGAVALGSKALAVHFQTLGAGAVAPVWVHRV